MDDRAAVIVHGPKGRAMRSLMPIIARIGRFDIFCSIFLTRAPNFFEALSLKIFLIVKYNIEVPVKTPIIVAMEPKAVPRSAPARRVKTAFVGSDNAIPTIWTKTRAKKTSMGLDAETLDASLPIRLMFSRVKKDSAAIKYAAKAAQAIVIQSNNFLLFLRNINGL